MTEQSDMRAVEEWLAEQPRSWLGRVLIEFFTICAWLLIGFIGVMIIGMPAILAGFLLFLG